MREKKRILRLLPGDFFVMKNSSLYLTLLFALLIALPAGAQTSRRQPAKDGKSKQSSMAPMAEKAEKSSAKSSDEKPSDDRITIHELKRKMDRKEEVVIIDTRAGHSYIGSSVKIKGAIHLTLDELQARMGELPKHKEIIPYCTCPDEATSASMAWTLRENGFQKVRPLIGGFDAWEKAGYPVEPKNKK
jgi:rhodanese-related sulfurtransferase